MEGMDWINIKDKLPEEGQKVIYYFKETGISIGYYSCKGGCDCFYSHDGWLCDDVTHWMPLPKPPDGE